MAYFPFMIDIYDKNCLVVGGGSIALHKVKILLGFEVNITVAAKLFDEAFFVLAKEQKRLHLVEREFWETDIEGMDFVIAATNQESVNWHISELCRRQGILVNTVDMKEACSFIFPAMIQSEDILVSVSSGGKSPAAVSYLKKKLKGAIPDYYSQMVRRVGTYREEILKEVPSAKERKDIFYRLLSYGEEHEGEIPEELVKTLVKSAQHGDEK
jgi:siroheme synthase-like protein